VTTSSSTASVKWIISIGMRVRYGHSVEQQKKQWHARVILRVRTRSDDGQLVDIPPGEYTLSEGQDARYQLIRHPVPGSVSLWFGDLLLCTYMGQLEILGAWP